MLSNSFFLLKFGKMDVTIEEGEYVMEIALANGCRLFVDREMLGNKRKVTSVFVGQMGMRENILSNVTLYYINGAFVGSQPTNEIDAIVARNTLIVHGLPQFRYLINKQHHGKVHTQVPVDQCTAVLQACRLSFGEMHLMTSVFTSIGKTKLWELRPDVAKRRHWDASTLVKVVHDNDPSSCCYVAIMETRTYPTFVAAIEALGINVVLPHLKTVNEGSRFHHNIEGYLEAENKYGVRAWRMIRLTCMIRNERPGA